MPYITCHIKKFTKKLLAYSKTIKKPFLIGKKYLLQVRLELTTPAFLIALSISTVR